MKTPKGNPKGKTTRRIPLGWKLPPAEFSNAMHDLYPTFDYTEWSKSKEWRLFNAGRAAMARDLSDEAAIRHKHMKGLSE